MATITVKIKRSDRFPVGTSVGAYSPLYNRHAGGAPSGSAVSSATVAADGSLTLRLAEGIYQLYAEVAGVPTHLMLGVGGPQPEPQTLAQRLAAKRVEVGA